MIKRSLADLDPNLRLAVSLGLMTPEQAFDADAFADGLTARVASGELTENEAAELAAKQGEADGQAFQRAKAKREHGGEA